ncbi:MAG: hypothetical protein KDA87_24605, partial [Planctomycetales bacterium]|nr:hypothetical protein [Planctomycetales bacterium]
MQSRRTLEHVSRQLNSAIFGKRKSTSARRRRRLRNGLERLEERTLLATVIWANPTGGDWRVGSNWSTGAEPTAIDDVVIPNYPGSPSIFLTAGTALVKSVTSFENLRLDGGRFTADTLTFSEGKLQIGAAQISGTLTEGIAEASNGAIFSNFATAIGTILNILPNASVSIAGSRTLEIGGSASIASGDTVNFSRSGPGTKLIVSGTLTASNVTFQNSFGFYVTGIEITGNGRLISTNNNFSVSSLSVLNGATVLPFDWSNNVFETDLTVPWYAVPSLSANQGGSNNVRFTTINIAAGVMPAGNTLTLARIGTDTASHANLRYRFPADFTVASGAILTINNDTVVELAANQELRIEGRANLLPGSTLSIEQSVPATEVIVTGILDVDHASILQGNPAWSTTVTITDGGRLLADSSTFTVKTLALLNGSVVGSTDWRNSIFDTELNIPWQSVANLSAATGGIDNVRFKTIRITEGTVPAGSSLTISQIGTDITSYANLLYRFGEDFTVSSGATLTVSNNTTLMVDANQTLLISGNANLRPGATLSLETSFPPTTLTVTGTINVDHATITRSSNSWNESFVVSNGGKLLADGAVISTRNLSLLNGSTIAPGEWRNSTFDTTLTIPWQAQRYLSAAGGGADNVRFQTINLAGNTIPAGQTLSLSNIGTDTASHANLLYRFPDHMTVAIDGGLALEADTHLEIEQGTTLTIDGGAVLLAGSVLSLMPESENTRVVVNGQMIVAEATITESRDLIRDTTLIIRSGGGITAVDSTFSTSRVIIEDGAAIDATSFNGNIFDTILTLPWNVHRYLSSAGGGSDNVRFR